MFNKRTRATETTSQRMPSTPAADCPACCVRRVSVTLSAALLVLCLTTGSPKAVDLTANGAQLSGDIIRATGSVVTIKLDVGRIINLAAGDISNVSINLQDGTQTEGTLLSWNDGVYVLSVGDAKVHVQDGQIIRSESLLPPAEQDGETVSEGVGSGGPRTDAEDDEPSDTASDLPSPIEPDPAENTPRGPQLAPSGATM